MAFCKIPTNKVTFKSFDPITKMGETTDGRTWAFDVKQNTFTEY